jgi:MFS family permease
MLPVSSQFRQDQWAVLKLPQFRSYAASRSCAGAAMTLLQATVAWQVYDLTGSALNLGLIGLVQFVPALAMSLVAGAVADAYDRRKVLLLAQTVPMLASASVLVAIVTGFISVPFLYAVVFCTALAQSFENPARQAILPAILPRELFSRAIMLNSVVQSLSLATGPSLGGLLIAAGGVQLAYSAHLVLLILSIAAMLTLRMPTRVSGPARGVNLTVIREGVAFVWHRPVVLGAMTLDMFAVVFGGAKALLPVYARDILNAGPTGYGILSSSLEAGSLVMALTLVALPTPRKTGLTLLTSVAAYGIATTVFGASSWFPLSVISYMAVGMADQLSVVMRQTTIQLNTPDELRGRVTAVNQTFIATSNQLGAVESGFVAAISGSPEFAVVSGGLVCLLVVATIAWRIPELRVYQAHLKSEA